MIKPGDIIEWVYKDDNNVVAHDEQCYSSTMKQWIPIGGEMIVISVVDSAIYFLRKEGLFHARVAEDRASTPIVDRDRAVVVPRVACARMKLRRDPV